MNDNLNAAHVAWCKGLFATLHDHGVWGVPRSGLLFQRQGDKLVLIARMPHDKEMPITVEQLTEQQTNDFEDTRKHFGAAGIPVTEVAAPAGPATGERHG